MSVFFCGLRQFRYLCFLNHIDFAFFFRKNNIYMFLIYFPFFKIANLEYAHFFWVSECNYVCIKGKVSVTVQLFHCYAGNITDFPFINLPTFSALKNASNPYLLVGFSIWIPIRFQSCFFQFFRYFDL